jgi:hypothetical protein
MHLFKQDATENLMINRWEMLNDVEAQNIPILFGVGLELVYRPMGPLPFSVGVAMGIETFLKMRLNDVAQGVMDNAISKGSGRYFAPFRLMNIEVMICTRPITSVNEFSAKINEVIGQL